MLRNKNLIPLSHQHQHALALCVRIERASPVSDSDLDSWQAEVAQHVEHEIRIHFAAEEKVLFPVALKFPELQPLVDELLSEHATLRVDFAKAEARTMSAQDLLAFVQRLSAHIRKEERQLFEGVQERMSRPQLESLGSRLQEALEEARAACALLRPKKAKIT